jgi:hypothetical protein
VPYKSEKIKLTGLQDRRKKLTDEQKHEIREIYKTQKVGTRILAKQFGVSRTLIQIIVNPEIAEKRRIRQKEHWQEYSDRKKLTESVRKLRQYKQELYLKGELKENIENRENILKNE